MHALLRRKTTIYLMRHAESNRHRELAMFRWPLSEAGKRQAANIPFCLNTVKFGLILSSPHERCLDTVRPHADRHGIGIRVVDGLRDRDTDEDMAIQADELTEESWNNFEFRPGNAESFRQYQQRMVRTITQLAGEFTGQSICIVSHHAGIGLFLNAINRSFGGSHAAAMRSPDLFKVTFDKGKFQWEANFLPPESFTSLTIEPKQQLRHLESVSNSR